MRLVRISFLLGPTVRAQKRKGCVLENLRAQRKENRRRKQSLYKAKVKAKRVAAESLSTRRTFPGGETLFRGAGKLRIPQSLELGKFKLSPFRRDFSHLKGKDSCNEQLWRARRQGPTRLFTLREKRNIGGDGNCQDEVRFARLLSFGGGGNYVRLTEERSANAEKDKSGLKARAKLSSAILGD